ncbi:hypothetical protein BD779DRAFT_1455102, partial [Infundibulicybe gibba]
MVTGFASGALRQEFRELEVLDEISRLRFEGKLHQSVIGARRNELIKSFREWKGLHYVPQAVHKAIRWSSKDPLEEPEIQDLPWQIAEATGKNKKVGPPSTTGIAIQTNDASRKGRFVPAKGTQKRKANPGDLMDERKTKKLRYAAPRDTSEGPSGPIGLEWRLNSCAYDSVLAILHAVWESNPGKWTAAFDNIN